MSFGALFASSTSVSLYDQIRDIAVPVALFISIVMQKLSSIKAERAQTVAQEARESLARQMEEQKQAADKAVVVASDAAKAVTEKLEAQNRDSEKAAQEVKTQLAKATTAQQIKMEEIHVDVNSKMGAQKKKTWEFALALAQRSGSNAEDMANARAAEKDYIDHMEAQARADERVRMVKEAAEKALASK